MPRGGVLRLSTVSVELASTRVQPRFSEAHPNCNKYRSPGCRVAGAIYDRASTASECARVRERDVRSHSAMLLGVLFDNDNCCS